MLRRNSLAEKLSKVDRSDYSFRLQVAGFKFLLAAWRLHLAALFLLTGCSISYGVYHTIEKGQTLWRIAKAYDVDIQDVAEFNEITDITQIKQGQKLFIPGASQILKVEPYRPAAISEPKTEEKKNAAAPHTRPDSTVNHQAFPKESEGKIVVEKWRFSWPVKGNVISTFGVRNGKKYDGIDIAAPTGTPVSAAAEGEVIYSDNGVKSYGNIVMLKHKQGFITLYAHNKENLVKIGAVVKKGDVIAKLGDTGSVSSPRLHFEVRKDRKPRNPLFFLP